MAWIIVERFVCLVIESARAIAHAPKQLHDLRQLRLANDVVTTDLDS